MTADIRSKLMNEFSYLNGLQYSEGVRPIGSAHRQLTYTPKRRSDSYRASAIGRFRNVIDILLTAKIFNSLFAFTLIHCGFHDMVANPPGPTVTG